MDKFKRSLLPESLRGVVLLYTGQAGAGKTVATLLDPNNTVFIDADHIKGKEMAAKKPKMIYKPVNSNDSENLVLTGELFLKAISEVDEESTTVVVIDNIHEIDNGLHAYAIANPLKLAKMYNLISKNISGRIFGHDILAHERIIKGIIDALLAKNITVIITTHMKPKFMVPGQLEIKARRWVYEAASMVGIMIRTGGAPDMLVFKNAFNYHIDVDVDTLSDEQFEQYRNGEIEISKVYQRIPRRIPAFTPTKLYKYLSRSPEEIQATSYGPDEILSEDEMAPYLEILTKEQRANVEKIMEREEEEKAKHAELEANVKESQRAELELFIEENPDKDMPSLVREAKLKFPMFASELSPVYVLKIRNG